MTLLIGLGATACRAATDSTAQPATATATTFPTAADAAVVASAAPTRSSMPPGSAGAGGPGSLAVDITSPVAVAGHASTAVSCQSTARRYVESGTTTVNGRTVSQSVRVIGYNGPGSYPAVITVSVVAPDSGRYAIDAVPATVDIASAGGSMSFSASTTAGPTLAGSISWACAG
ncbi:hypothetical protein UK82_01480 [Frankia sp. ACN1ag]|nr:hypothetical protein UK82_01480 [Frankia sp. ACN1ag]